MRSFALPAVPWLFFLQSHIAVVSPLKFVIF